jgi:hypothetical protein
MKLRIQNSCRGIKRKIWSARRKTTADPLGLSHFIQEILELTGFKGLHRPVIFGVASATACFYNPHEAHELKSLGYVFWR